MTNSQPTSPVISPATSTTAGVFSQVRTAADNRLNHTVTGYNRLPNVIASGRAVKPQATISNDMVAAIEAYTPKPGRQVARSMNLDVRNTPPPQVDSIIDAIQRYLDIKPRREPTADPKAEASVARHPQQIIQSAQRWEDASRYQFASNGVETLRFRPEYHAWAGGLDLTIENEGSADIYAPPTRSPMSGPSLMTSSSALGQNVVHDPVDAAQSAMGRMLEMQAAAPEHLTAGAPVMTENPYFDPTYAAQNAAAKIRADLSNLEKEGLKVGPGGAIHDPVNAVQSAMSRMSEAEAPDPQFISFGAPAQNENPYFDPAHAAQNAAAKFAELDSPKKELFTVGPGGVSHDPVDAVESSMSQMMEVQPPAPHFYTFGAPVQSENPYFDPARAAHNAAAKNTELLNISKEKPPTVGPANVVDDPNRDPVYIAENVTAENTEKLNRERLPQYTVGTPNMIDIIYNQPRGAWLASTQVAYGLGQQSGINLSPASSFRPMADNDAYIRAMHIMNGMNRGPVIGGKV